VFARGAPGHSHRTDPPSLQHTLQLCRPQSPTIRPHRQTALTTKTPLKPLKKHPDDGGQRQREANKLQLYNRPNLSNRHTRPKIHQGVDMMLAAEK